MPFVDPASGKRVEPGQPNAIKFERFIFDLLPAAERAIVVEVDWEQAFAPLKNGSGEAFDTPETVQQQMVALARLWLAEAGAQVADTATVEICPLFAEDAEQLAQRIPPGLAVTGSRYFC